MAASLRGKSRRNGSRCGAIRWLVHLVCSFRSGLSVAMPAPPSPLRLVRPPPRPFRPALTHRMPLLSPCRVCPSGNARRRSPLQPLLPARTTPIAHTITSSNPLRAPQSTGTCPRAVGRCPAGYRGGAPARRVLPSASSCHRAFSSPVPRTFLECETIKQTRG